MEPLAECFMCEEWQADKCRQNFGRCGYQEREAMAGAELAGNAKPRWIEVWMEAGEDASQCPGLGLTVQGGRELDIIRAEAGDKDCVGQPADNREWARKAAAGV